MLAYDDLFLQVYVLIDDLLKEGRVVIPVRPGPKPSCSDAEILTITTVRQLLGRRSEQGFLEEVKANWQSLFPHLPVQSEFNRRVRWLWGASELIRQELITACPTDLWGQVDTSALPIKHPSRHRADESHWAGPNDLLPGFGRDAAHAEWFYGFRLAVLTDLERHLVRAWAIVPAAVNERDVADALLDQSDVRGLLLDRGFVGREWALQQAELGRQVIVTPSRKERETLPKPYLAAIAALRNRVETAFGQITDKLELARHGAKSFWGLLTRTAGAILAHTLLTLAYV
jgi:hypothetical protein